MRSSDIPCQNCQDRHLGCHDHCEKYQAFKRKGQAEREAKDKYYEGLRNIAITKYQHKQKMY